MPEIGPRTREQLARFGREWQQGMHVLVTGKTGSGKTTLARHLLNEHIRRGGFVCVFVGKLGRDDTITRDYSRTDGWIRWKKWPAGGPKVYENKVLLWPDTDRFKDVKDMRTHQANIFRDAFNRLAKVGHWTVMIDEGLYTTSPAFLGLADYVALLHQQGRSSDLSLMTLAQRPSNLPLVIYGSASHAFTGVCNLPEDRKRLAELGTNDPKELMSRIAKLGRYEFMWTPVISSGEPEIVALTR